MCLLLLLLVLLHVNVRYEQLFIVVDILMCWNNLLGPLVSRRLLTVFVIANWQQQFSIPTDVINLCGKIRIRKSRQTSNWISGELETINSSIEMFDIGFKGLTSLQMQGKAKTKTRNSNDSSTNTKTMTTQTQHESSPAPPPPPKSSPASSQ